MVPLQLPGGPELFMTFLMFVLMGFVPLAIAATPIYLLYRIRQNTKSMATSLERIAAAGSSLADPDRAGADGGGPPPEGE